MLESERLEQDYIGTKATLAESGQEEDIEDSVAAAEDESKHNELVNAKFVMSNLPLAKKEVVTRFITQFDCGKLQMGIDDSTTHVIVKTEENLFAQRTLKYLQGIGRGLMLVSHLWCEVSLAVGRLLPASDWEVLDAELEGAQGPRLSRLAQEAGDHAILRGWEIMIVGEITAIPAQDMVDFLNRLGARHIFEYEDFSKDNVKKAVIVDDFERISDKVARKYLRVNHVAFVDKEWLMETLCSWSVRPLLRYMPFGITRDNVIQLGKYPPQMVGHREYQE